MGKNWGFLIAIGILLFLLMRKDQPAIQTAHNKETWNWTDFRGNKREIMVSREVEVR